MEKYAKIIDEDTKEVQVGVGCPDEYYIEIGMTLMEVEEAYNGNWYVQGYAPVQPPPPPPTKEDIKQKRKNYRQEHIDDSTNERSRRMANKTWTEQDEIDYLNLDAEVTAYIEEHFPYPDEEDPEYDVLVEG